MNSSFDNNIVVNPSKIKNIIMIIILLIKSFFIFASDSDIKYLPSFICNKKSPFSEIKFFFLCFVFSIILIEV